MTDILDVNPTEVTIATITSSGQALNWMDSLIAEMVHWRRRCDVIFPGNKDRTVKYQNRALWTFLVKHGEVIGALKTLNHVGLISERAFVEYNQRAINSLIPKVVGVVQ